MKQTNTKRYTVAETKKNLAEIELLNNAVYQFIENIVMPKSVVARQIGLSYQQYHYRIMNKTFTTEEIKKIIDEVSSWHT